MVGRILTRMSLTQKNEPSAVHVQSAVHAMRRAGARRELSERVALLAVPAAVADERDVKVADRLEGWALNVSSGGIRVILEAAVGLGDEFDVIVGDDGAGLAKRARVVWIQVEHDGVVAGMEFIGESGVYRARTPVNAS